MWVLLKTSQLDPDSPLTDSSELVWSTAALLFLILSIVSVLYIVCNFIHCRIIPPRYFAFGVNII